MCHSCGSLFDLGSGIQAGRELLGGLISGPSWTRAAARLTGLPDELEVGDLLELLEDPDDRPYVWDLDPD